MKKLLGGLFARSPSTESPRASATPSAAASGSVNRWGAFLLPSAPPSAADQVMLNLLDAAMRGLAAHVKAVIAGSADGEELHKLVQFAETAVNSLQQHSCEPSVERLSSYFSWPEGIFLCEQTAFPSLVLDFMSKMRVFAMEEELRAMRTGDDTVSGRLVDECGETMTVGFAQLVPVLQLLMTCVVAVTANETLMDTFRCELPNLLALTAEEYPPMALFIRDLCGRALMAVSERNFNAGLAWYLLDCHAIRKTIQLMTNYTLATMTTPETAARALELYENATHIRSQYGGNDISIDDSAAAAAVSEALGLSRTVGATNDHDEVATPTSPQKIPPIEVCESGRHATKGEMSEIFCLPCYDVRVGLKAVIYVIERTHRFTPILLDEFQTAGGYTLLLRLLETCTEEEIPPLLALLTSLLPFGPRSTDANDSNERPRSGNVFSSRNVIAFAAMRDLLLTCVAGPDRRAETDTEYVALARRRNEHLILQLLTNVLHIYTSAYENFVFLEPKTRLLALLLTKLPFTAFYDAQVIILRIVEYVCCSANPDDPLPHEILSIVCGMLIAYGPLSVQRDTESGESQRNADLSSKQGTPKDLVRNYAEDLNALLSTLMCECLIKILRNCEADRYKQELSGFGLMDRGVYLWLDRIATSFTSAPATDVPTLHELLTALKPHLELYGHLLCLMLRDNASECIRYRESRIHQSVYVIIEALVSGDLLSTPFDPANEVRLFESSDFSVVSAFVEPAGSLRSASSCGGDFASSITLLRSGVESDLSFILQLLQRFRGAVWRQVSLLCILKDTLTMGGPMIASSWKGCQGYEILLALLSSVELAHSGDAHDHAFQMMELIFMILGITLGSQANAEYFKSIEGYSTTASCIVTSGALNSAKKAAVVQRILALITGDGQQREISHGDAVQILFCLLPALPSSEAVDIMVELLSMLETAGDTAIIRRKEQIGRLVLAGVLQWVQEPELIKRMLRPDDQLKPFLAKWIVSIVLEEDLSIPRLQEFMEIAGKTMPGLIGGHNSAKQATDDTSEESTEGDSPEVGLLLLQSVLRNPAIRHISVGKPQGAEQTGRYVHIVNSADRVWPPSSGYSFSCWLRFPATPVSNVDLTDASASKSGLENDSCCAVPVALCEGYIRVMPDMQDGEQMCAYGVLVGTTLTLFSSSDCATQNREAIAEMQLSNISRTGPLDWSFSSTTGRYLVSCTDTDSMEMWWRAMEQPRTDGSSADDTLLASFGGTIDGPASTSKPASDVTSNTEEGSACIVSIYSLESSGCFIRAFFEHSTGFLRFHAGAVSSGHGNQKRTSLVFESVVIDDFRPSASDNSSLKCDECKFPMMTKTTDRKRDWHHFAFTHRKSVVGSSVITVYVDGMEVATQKLSYPSAPAVGSFQAFVGSDAQVCSPHSALSWKVGPMWLTDEVVSNRTVAAMFSLGPTFSHQFSGHSYRSVGDWPEALASSHLARAADRGIDILQFAQRLQLSRLGRSCRRQWRDSNDSSSSGGSAQNAANDTVTSGAALIAESMIAKKEELAEGLRLATGGAGVPTRKTKNKTAAFRNFVSYDCALSSFGVEIESLLGVSKLPDDTALFTLNTSSSDRSNTPVLANTQVHYINCAQSSHLDLAISLPYVGGIGQVFFPLLDQARHQGEFYLVLKMLVNVLRRNPACLADCIGSNGYAFVTAVLSTRVHLINEKALRYIVRLAVAGKLVPYATGTTTKKALAHPVVVNVVALTQVVLSTALRRKLPHHLHCQLVSLLMDLLVVANPNSVFNARQLRRAGLLQWILAHLSELGNEGCEMNSDTALEMRWCFPKFIEPTFEAILQYALSLLRAFLRLESHVDDVYGITETILLSMTSTAIHSRDSPIRVILLQFILHEIENDSLNSSNNGVTDQALKGGSVDAQRLSDTIIEAVLHREVAVSVVKKRDDRRLDSGNSVETASLGSPVGESSSKVGKGRSSTYPVDCFASVLLDVIDRESDTGRWISVEALLAVRVLLSLAQVHVGFAEHLLCRTMLTEKLQRVLLKYSTDCCAYIPLLAYVFRIPVGDTSYNDPDTFSGTEFVSASSSRVLQWTDKCTDQIWNLIGELLLQNCNFVDNAVATEANVDVLGIISNQMKASTSFFAGMCKSSGTIFRIIVQCMCSCLDDDDSSNNRYGVFERLIGSMTTEISRRTSTASACVNLTQTIMIRALFDSDEFGCLMMLYLETLDETIVTQHDTMLSRVSGQRFWLALLNCIIDNETGMTAKCSLVSMKNICTVCVALARYLADEDSHWKELDSTSQADGDEVCSPGAPLVQPTHVLCFGEEAFCFLVRCCKFCAESTTTQALGADEQQFFYGSLIYSAQNVLLNELGGAHKDTLISEQLLDCLVESKHILLEQPSWQGIVICGVLAKTANSEVTGGLDVNASSGRSRRMHRVRSLSANAHKEFGIGTESDRSFILSLASLLFRMLMDDAVKVRHTAIVMWQYLIDQRFNVLKELLIAEPRASLLHTITATKKEASVDIFHGGFDRLLYALHTTEAEPGTAMVEANDNASGLNKEIWCQFQLWLADNNALLTDLLIARTDAIYRHMQDVVLSCTSLHKLPSAIDAHDTLQLNFPVRVDVRKESNASQMYEDFESDPYRRDMIAKKAVAKFSSLKDSAVESMNDGLSQWRETSLRFAYTRNIWRTGRWQTTSPGNCEAECVSDFALQRSLFQRRSSVYRLDTTEGPQRLRLRLIRDYASEEKPRQKLSENQPASADDQPEEDSLSSSLLSVTSNVGNLENEIFRRSGEFHEAVEVFREFSYLQSTIVAHGDDIYHSLENILRRCRMDSTRETFAGIDKPMECENGSEQLTALVVARVIYTSFFDGLENGGGKRTMGVSPSIITDIDQFIQKAADNSDDNIIHSTLFDAADYEATQYALCSARASIRSVQLDIPVVPDNDNEVERDGSDDGVEDETGNLVDDVDSDDSDGPGGTKEEVSSDKTVFGQESIVPDENEGETIEVSLLEPTSPKAEQTKQVDTSSDAVYGAVARFLRRDDYPPMRSYNATFIAGMGGNPGLFLVCRSGLYFIGGYTKLCNDLVSDGDAIDASDKPTTVFFDSEGEQLSNQPSWQRKLSTTPTGGRKKTTKTLLRAALTDLRFSQSKTSGEQFFTVVPLADMPVYSTGKPSSASYFTGATTSRWSIKYSNVKQFCRIKYQLRPVGIEFFDTFGSTYFVQLDTSADREEIVKLMFQMPLVNSIFWNPVFRTGSIVPSTKRIRQALTKRWVRGSISNFEYLIHLNTLAGRSFNDITQYPVFPWIIADYTSEFLDLDARKTFRDLSKPMGAIGASRAAQFSERYTSMNQDMDVDDPMGTPAFHYGTHYSCSAYVVNYLIRLEPFTALALELQGGIFDHPDRLFRSIPSSWASASKENLQDVRELIPEFYYLPEFLYNANDCVFGTTQSGEEVCHVILPPWAHGDPREFIRLNRRALESKYVSEHLHKWIDLVFGAKQTGQAAVDALNVFMHFTYEGTVDIDKISDPVMRTATLAQIENFGQTPSRLFSDPHPQRKVPTLLAVAPTPSQVVETSSVPVMNPSVGHQYDGITLSTIETYVKWHTPLAPALVSIGKDYVFLKKHSVVSAQLNGGAIGDVKLIHDKMQYQGTGCTFMPPRFAKYLDWGNNGGLVKLRVHQQSAGRYREGNKVLAIIEGAHHDGINCAAVSDDGTLLVTGGQDAVVNLIECSKASDGRRVFKQATKFVGHTDSVVCVAIDKEFNLIASSSVDRSVLLWDLRTRALLQELAGHTATVAHVSINGSNGNVLTTTHSELRLWSINGDLLAASSSSAFGLQDITCAISTRCESWQSGVIAVTGHANGAIALWGLRYPAELARQKKDNLDAETTAAEKLKSSSDSGVYCTSPSSSKRTELTITPVSISASSNTRKQVLPSCQLFILKLLLDHRTKVTALTLGPDQRQLLSGDAEGNCIRWVDDSISTNIH